MKIFMDKEHNQDYVRWRIEHCDKNVITIESSEDSKGDQECNDNGKQSNFRKGKLRPIKSCDIEFSHTKKKQKNN